MKKVHELRVWPEFYFRMANGSKTFEYRENDKNFQAGDKVIFKEWDPTPINPEFDAPIGFTGNPPLEFQIGYVLQVGRDMIVFSLLPVKKSEFPENESINRTKKKSKDA